MFAGRPDAPAHGAQRQPGGHPRPRRHRPAAAGTYFVSVSRGDTILAKQDYRLNVDFPRNSDRLRLTGEQIDLVVPVDDKLTGAAYSVLVGFQLTPTELAFNRRRGPR